MGTITSSSVCNDFPFPRWGYVIVTWRVVEALFLLLEMTVKKQFLPGASWMGNGEFAWRGRTWCERRCVLGVVVLVLVLVLVLALFVLVFVLLVPVLVIVVFFLLLFLLFHLFFFLIVLVIVIAVVSVVEMFHHNSTTLYYIYLMHCKIEWIWKWWDWQGVPRSANLQ